MQTISFVIKYDGSHYHGWQRQNRVVGVQAVIEKALKRVLKQDITVEGSGRTDAGVHALGQCASFKAHLPMPVENLRSAVNKILPNDVFVLKAHIVPDTFHARFSAVAKTYTYKIYTLKERDPFMDRYCYHYPHSLDIEAIKRAMSAFIGTHDFRTFMASGSETVNTVRTVYAFSLELTGDTLAFTITGNGFLYNMVRIIIGTLLHVGTGKLSPESIPEIINSQERSRARFTTPGHGLYLKRVFYSNQELKESLLNNYKNDGFLLTEE